MFFYKITLKHVLIFMSVPDIFILYLPLIFIQMKCSIEKYIEVVLF